MTSEDIIAADRARWGGPSPWAGKDSRTEAQKLADKDEVLADLLTRVYEHLFNGNQSAAMNILEAKLTNMGVNLDRFI